MIRAMELSIKDFRIGFFVGILSKNRSKKKLTPNTIIRPPTMSDHMVLLIGCTMTNLITEK
jgi:hypothetical protein